MLNDLTNEKSIKAFKQHGFYPESSSGDQIIGNCIFCEKKNKFYVNIKTKKWDCKVCGLHGGFKTFLMEVATHCKQFFTGSKAKELSKNKSISKNTLKSFNVGYNPHTSNYIYPVYNIEQTEVLDIRIYKNNRFISTATCKTTLGNWKEFMKGDRKIWICEGEWDGMAFYEAMQLKEIKEVSIVWVPGVEIFKGDWTIYFKDKDVRIVYDNDDAGNKGSLKVYNNIKGITRSLKFVHWPSNIEDKFDFRDFYKKYKEKSYSKIIKLLKSFPPGVDKKELEEGEDSNNLSGRGITPAKVYNLFKKWLHLPDTTVLDVIFGTVIANRLPGDPLWLFLVAPPGGTKTEILMTLSDAPKIYTTSSLTPHALVSGASSVAGDPSLIPKLKDKVLVIKDFTTILNMNQTHRDEIFGILRDAYDGKTEKVFGNNVVRSYDSKFGIIAAVTPIIEQYTEEHASLGERFLRYYMPIVKNPHDIIRRAMSNVTQEDKMRKELKEISTKVLSTHFDVIPEIPPEIAEKIMYLAQWTSLMRGTITRDKYTKEVTHRPFTEVGTRLAKQFCKLVIGIAMFHRAKKVQLEYYEIIRDVALATVPSKLEDITRRMFKQGLDRVYNLEYLINKVGLPSMTIRRAMENLVMLKILRKNRVTRIKEEWEFRPEIINMINGAELYKTKPKKRRNE